MQDFWNITAAGRHAEIDIEGEIGFSGDSDESVVSARFVKEIRALRNISSANINIHSQGGSVADGMAIYQALREMPGKKVVRVPALAASIATVIALAGDEVLVAPEAIWGVHNPQVRIPQPAYAAEVENKLKFMRQMREAILNIYERRTGADRDRLSDMMDAEEILIGEEIKEAGFATGVISDAPRKKIAASWADTFNTWKKPPVLKPSQPAPLSPEIAARYEKVRLFNG